jgi:hypothetical protein
MDYYNSAEMAINVLCDLKTTRCAACEKEQEISDNQQLLDPKFGLQFVKERNSSLINKQKHHCCEMHANCVPK